MTFTLQNTDGSARAGLLATDRGILQTPVFMPVGTQGTVKAIEPRELREIGARIILGNTYHLYLKPGVSLIERSGGLHGFVGWDWPILTDSGGYQVYSLSDLRGIDPEGVNFKSHHDGSVHRFTPESVVDIQRSLGSDIMMVLDECPAYPCDEEYAERSNALTLRWAARCREQMALTQPRYGAAQSLFAIVQGSVFPRIRELSARGLVSMDFDGYAIGGLSVGEPVADMYAMTELCTGILPASKPRYLMGVGTPENLVESIARGIDMFDCVLPTRNGRNATVFTRHGRLNLRNAKFTEDLSSIDPDCNCYACANFSRAYLRHLFKAREILGLQLATIHNLSFYLWLLGQAREAILQNRFRAWKESTLRELASEDFSEVQ